MWKFDEYNDSKARNRLPFMLKVQAIYAYERTPNYSKVGLMFKCSAKQIRTIVKNKEKILAQYASLPKNAVEIPDEEKPSYIRRRKKIALLGSIMYEWFLRARRNPSICIISYTQIQNVALEVKQILNVENFFPNNSWLLHFRQKFNISDSDMKVQSNDPGPTELDIYKIISEVVVREKTNLKSLKKQYSLGNDDSSASSSTNAMEMVEINYGEHEDEEHPSKYPKMEPIDIIEIESDDDDEAEDYDDDINSTGHGQAEKKVSIKTIDQALQHLKPLEDFALMKEDYRVIGLLSQLEIILNSSKNK